jgi:hypothetical protein
MVFVVKLRLLITSFTVAYLKSSRRPRNQHYNLKWCRFSVAFVSEWNSDRSTRVLAAQLATTVERL